MQQTLSTAVEHGLSEIFALHIRLYPLHPLDELSKLSLRRSSYIWAYNNTTETSRPSTVELEDSCRRLVIGEPLAWIRSDELMQDCARYLGVISSLE